MKKIVEAYRKGKLITPPYKFYFDVAEEGSVTPKNCELLENGGNLFDTCRIDASELSFDICSNAGFMFQSAGVADQKIKLTFGVLKQLYAIFQLSLFSDVEIIAPECTVASFVFQAAWNLERCRVDIPNVYIFINFLNRTKVRRFAGSYPKLVDASEFATDNSLLEEIDITTNLVTTAKRFAFNNNRLWSVPLSWPKLQTANEAFTNCSLSAETINAILESLPIYIDGTHVITFTGCPGAAICSPEIATTKGWTVEL